MHVHWQLPVSNSSPYSVLVHEMIQLFVVVVEEVPVMMIVIFLPVHQTATLSEPTYPSLTESQPNKYSIQYSGEASQQASKPL